MIALTIIIITIMRKVIKISMIIMLVTMILIIIITVLGRVVYHTQNLREKQYFSERIIIIKWFEVGMMIN